MTSSVPSAPSSFAELEVCSASLSFSETDREREMMAANLGENIGAISQDGEIAEAVFVRL